MKAWLVTWAVVSKNANAIDKIVAIFSVRKGERFIVDFLENHYLRVKCNAREMAYLANRKNSWLFTTQTQLSMGSHLYPTRILCGHSPVWLYARVVSDLTIQQHLDRGVEILTWKEPEILQLKEDGTIEFINEIEWHTYERASLTPLDGCLAALLSTAKP